MLAPVMNEWSYVLNSVADGTQPSTTFGTSVTPATNSFGSYAQLVAGASVTYDLWELDIVVHGLSASGVARNAVVRLGIDPAGGTSYTTVADLLVGPAGSITAGGVRFTFPYAVKAGSSIGIAGSVNSGTLTAFRAFCTGRGMPSHPESIRAGAYIDAFGVTLASSSGTAVTPGTAAEGSWTEIGTLTRTCWHWNFGIGVNDSTMTALTMLVDIGIGDASNKKIVISNAWTSSNTAEEVYKGFAHSCGYGLGVSGDKVYARIQASTTPDSNVSIACYGTGG